MTLRIYMAKLLGDGLTPETAYRPAWIDLLNPAPQQFGQTTDSEKYHFWIGQLETTQEQHDLLVADSQVRYIPETLLNTTISALTVAQKNAILEVLTWLGFPTAIFAQEAHVKDVLFYLVGKACWKPVSLATV